MDKFITLCFSCLKFNEGKNERCVWCNSINTQIVERKSFRR
jgi:hypothetical protein